MMNPILVSSARRRMRSFRTCAVFTLYGLVLFAMAFYTINTLGAPSITLSDMRAGIDGYILMVILQFVLIILVAPAMTAGAISGERERQTLDLMLVTSTGSLRIATGKLLEGFLFLALLVLSSAPFMAIVLLSGGIALLQIAQTLLFLLIASFAALCVGLLSSSMFKRTATSTVVSYLMIFAIGIGTLAPVALPAVRGGLRKYAEDPMLLEALTRSQSFALMPTLLFVNPGIGLFSLLTSQTELMYTSFRGYIPNGGTYYALLEKLGFSWVANVNLCIMFGLALLLILITALFVRPRVTRRKRK